MAEESNKTWTVVKFVEENTVAMVPTAWITNSINGSSTLWPPLPSNKITVAVKNHQIDPSWPSFNVIVFRNATYDDYQAARRAVLKAEETSDLNTDNDMPSKRKRIMRKISSGSSSCDDDILIKIKTPPKFNMESKANYDKVKMVKQNLEPHLGLTLKLGQKQKNLELMEQQSSSKGQENCYMTNENRNRFENNLRDFEKGNSNEKVPLDASASIPTVPSVKELNNCSCTCCPVHVHYTKEILKQVMFIKSRVNDIPTEPIFNPGLHSALQLEKSLFENPLPNEEALSEFNKTLKNVEFFEKAVKELSRVGGKNIYEFCVRCLKKLVTNELSNGYSWLGRRNKKSFSDLEISKLIIAAAEAGGKAKDKKEVEEAISGWLRRANDRLKAKRN